MRSFSIFLQALAFGAGVAVIGLVPQGASARIVAEPELAAFCKGEASAKIGTRPTNLMTLPVERSHGKFYVYGQTDEANPTLFNCVFDGKGKFLKLDVQGGHEHGAHAAAGAPKAAINKCLQMIGAPAKVETVSPLKPGYFEIILAEKTSNRRVACTVPADGSVINDWVEMD